MKISKDISDDQVIAVAFQLGYQGDDIKDASIYLTKFLLDDQIDPIIKNIAISSDPDIQRKQEELAALIESKTKEL